MKLKASAIVTVTLLLCMFTCTAQAAPKKVVLNWTAPVAKSGITITGYKIYRGTAAGAEGSTAFAAISSGTVTTFTDTNVTGGTSYFYEVTATASCDATIWDCSTFVAESVPSNEASSGIIPLPAAPTIGAPTAATAVVQ